MWQVLGQGNEGAVRGLISAAARTDRRYCAELQNLALLSRARALLKAGGEGQADALAQLLQQEPALAVARDQEGRSLWHDLAAGEQVELLRRLLPLAVPQVAGGQQQVAAGGPAEQASDEQQQLQQQQQREPNPLNLTDLTGNTPLHVAAEAASAEVARLLIDAGAAVDMQNRCAGWGGVSQGTPTCSDVLRLMALPHAAGFLTCHGRRQHRLPCLSASFSAPAALPGRDPSKYARGDWQVRSRHLDFTLPVPSTQQAPL